MIDYGQIDRFLSPTSAIGEVVIRPAEPIPYRKHMQGLGFEIPDPIPEYPQFIPCGPD